MAITIAAARLARIPRRLVQAKIPTRAQAVWLALASGRDFVQGVVCGRTQEIANQLQCSASTVRRALRDLINAGIIIRFEKGLGWKYPMYFVGKRQIIRMTTAPTPLSHNSAGLSSDISEMDAILLIAEKKSADYVFYLQALEHFGVDIHQALHEQAADFIMQEYRLPLDYLTNDPNGRALLRNKFMEVMADYFVKSGAPRNPDYYPPSYR